MGAGVPTEKLWMRDAGGYPVLRLGVLIPAEPKHPLYSYDVLTGFRNKGDLIYQHPTGGTARISWDLIVWGGLAGLEGWAG